MTPGVVFFLGQGLLEVSGPDSADTPGNSVMIWLQVRDVRAEYERLARRRSGSAPAVAEPWGLIEMWIEDPDGVRIVLVEVPAEHPLRRDRRGAEPQPTPSR